MAQNQRKLASRGTHRRDRKGLHQDLAVEANEGVVEVMKRPKIKLKLTKTIKSQKKVTLLRQIAPMNRKTYLLIV